MKRIPVSKLFAFAGWVLWPIVLSLPFVSYRITSRMSMEAWASYAGKLQARIWFQENHYRLLELSPDEKNKFTGRKDGEFEIWTWTHYTNSSWLVAESADREFVDAFNHRMRQLWDRKQNDQK
ncbi:MAG: hypothetical protein JWM68_5859 [Verrucomicrobiales bacterium]|nr:hypothetical protein [Verrucomicrobiales bacterium]